jgi:hypothetical protein
MSTLTELREQEFDASQLVRELRRAVFEDNRVDQIPALSSAERALQEASEARALAESKAGIGHGSVVAVKAESNLLGAATTGIEVKVDLCMAALPTALIHLFDASSRPLIRFQVRNAGAATKRLRFICYVEGYSAQSVETIELEAFQSAPITQLPTFFPDRLATVTELTRASINIEVQDLDARTEVHRTVPIWLLARTTAPLQVQDPSTGKWLDMTKYLGAFVTPNAAAVMEFLPTVVAKHPDKRLVGYQVDETEVALQVQAVFEALKQSGTKYVNSVIEFTPEPGSANQRVRLPRESLHNTSANCIDGTVLVASLLEAISLHPAIVIVPGHAFVAWETFRESGTWRYLETTMIPTHSFAEACARAEQSAAQWQAEASANPGLWRRLALRDLRAHGITPLE